MPGCFYPGLIFNGTVNDLAYGVMWDYDFKPVISLKVFSEARFRSSNEFSVMSPESYQMEINNMA
jgi:hypothetical protein